MVRRLAIFLFLTAFLSAPALALAEKPIDVIKTGVDKVVSILNDPAYDSPEKKKEQRDKIWAVIVDVFDFDTIARGTLRRHDWESFTEYEAAVNRVIGGYRMIAVCSYHLDRCGAAGLADVVNSHQFALVRRPSEWAVVA